MRLIDDIMNNKARRKVVLTGAVVGAAALLNSFGRSIDAKLPGYKKSGTVLPLRSWTLIGGALAVPGAACLLTVGGLEPLRCRYYPTTCATSYLA